MREKFTETPKDRAYMRSIDRNLHKSPAKIDRKEVVRAKSNPFADSYKAKNAKVHSEYAKSKALQSRKSVHGISRISGKTYNQ